MRVGIHRRCLWLLAVLAAAGAGCGARQRPLYEWHGYEASLQATQIAHDDGLAAQELEATVDKIETFGTRPPPGVLAEYGFLLFKRGDAAGAIGYFQSEARNYPEAKPLMERLIARVQERTAAEPGLKPEAEDAK